MADAAFSWGEEVLVASVGSEAQKAWVVGVRQKDDEWLYTVEYEDGSSNELPESDLRRR